MSKTEFYADLNRDFQALMAGETSFLAMIANTSALLFERLSEVNWAGFYLLEGDTLVLGPFQGKLACVRIPVGRGVCGAAVAQARSSASRTSTPLTATLPAMPPVIRKLSSPARERPDYRRAGYRQSGLRPLHR
jgi:hypothetical protein